MIVEGPDNPVDALEAARGRVIVIEGQLRSIVVVQLGEDGSIVESWGVTRDAAQS